MNFILYNTTYYHSDIYGKIFLDESYYLKIEYTIIPNI